ncbi:hypothetical protein GCM10010260_16750 [Streptomyces filipinensis]|uniref:Pentapeptide repeat-containing protein n=1 Tax=Streptomyces filipinensis TaxID=66887 RepID=A0A918M926_9ACTN|nr:hypothetical protein [Streptomyces filipinensis]GGU84356.1 hypothetical protein GCM10010260_16750 [Streptomyces filipinensis]
MVAAESFGGRVLAVLSRRAPAFRPPDLPTGHDGPTMGEGCDDSLDTPSFVQALLERGYALDRRFDLKLSSIENDAERLALRDIYGSVQEELIRGNTALTMARSYALRGELSFRQRKITKWIDQASTCMIAIGGLFLSPDVGQGGWVHPYAGGTAIRLSENLEILSSTVSAIPLRKARVQLPAVAGVIDAVHVSISRAFRKISKARDDFTGSDLSDANLESVNLTGLRWSDSTIWPPGWEERVRRSSEEKEPGVYVINSSGSGQPSRTLGV